MEPWTSVLGLSEMQTAAVILTVKSIELSFSVQGHN